MLKAARVTCTGVCARTGVHTEFQSLGMDIVGNGLDTVGELILVGNQPAVSVTLLFAPAVVDNDILVACVFQSAFNEKVSGGLYKFLADIPAESVPGVPAHGRCMCKRCVHNIFLSINTQCSCLMIIYYHCLQLTSI